MRTIEDREYERILNMLDVLKEMGITESNLQIAEEYFEEGDEKKLSNVQTQAFSDFKQSQRDVCSRLLSKIAKKNNELNVRFVHFLFAVGRQSIHHVMPYEMVGWNREQIKHAKLFDFLPRAKALAVFVADKATVIYSGELINISDYIKLGREEEDTLREALSYCNIGCNNAMVILSMVTLLLHREKNGRLIEEDYKLLKRIFDESIDNIDGIFNVQKNGSEYQILKEYFEQGFQAAGIPGVNGQNETMQGAVEQGDNAHSVQETQETDANELSQKLKWVLDKKHELDEYLATLLVAFPCNFCTEYHGFDNMMRACLQKRRYKMLEAVWNNVHLKGRIPVIMRVKEIGAISDYDFTMWAVKKRYKMLFPELLRRNKACFYRVFDQVEIAYDDVMMDVIKEQDPEYYQKLTAFSDSKYMKKMQEEIQRKIVDGARGSGWKDKIEKYMAGKIDISELYQLAQTDCYPSQNFGSLVELYYKEKGCDPFLNKINAMITIMRRGYYFYSFVEKSYDLKEGQTIEYKMLSEIMLGIADTGIEPKYILTILAELRDGYNMDTAAAAFAAASCYLRQEMPKQHDVMMDILVNESSSVRCMAVDYLCGVKNQKICTGVLVTKTAHDCVYEAKYAQETDENKGQKEVCLADLSRFFGDSAKSVKEKMIQKFGSVSDCKEFICEKLTSKKLGERQMAVALIETAKDKGFQAELEQMLEKEKNVKLAARIRGILGIAQEPQDGEESAQPETITTEIFISKLHQGNRKRAIEWLFSTPFAQVHKKDGTLADDKFLQAVLLCYYSMNVPGMNKEVGVLTDLLVTEELEVFAAEVFDKWMGGGAQAKQKWVLYFSSVHGGSVMAERLKREINEWPKISRGAIAAEAVKALALNPSPTALMTVDSISRKFKFKQVKSAAGQAMKFAADELGISIEELADRIVPTLGFDANMEQIFDYGNRSFKVELNNHLELSVYDAKGKQLKNMPAPGKTDDQVQAPKANKAFKEMKKQLKTVVASQRLRLEQALSTERKWTKEAWEKLFVENPIMHCFAMSLIWGIYDGLTLQTSFRYMEDGTFNTVDEEELEIPENAMIGLVHPSELEQELIAGWKEQLSDYEVTQPFEQLERTVYTYQPEEAEQYKITRFKGLVINGMSLNGKMTGFGWYKGDIEDAGCYYNFYREDKILGISAELSFEGLSVGYEFEEETTIEDLTFYKAGAASHCRYAYKNESEKEEHGIKVKELPKRYFSEIIYQVTKALASAKEDV